MVVAAQHAGMNEPLPPTPAISAGALGHTLMDKTHDEFQTLLAVASECADTELPDCLAEIATHLRSHFDAEEAWMKDSDYPATECHLAEHAAVRKSVGDVLTVVNAHSRVGRALIRELERWFAGHVVYLDTPLAHWLCRRRLGGIPVVFHQRRQHKAA